MAETKETVYITTKLQVPLEILHKSGLESEKIGFSWNLMKKVSLHLEIGMVVLYLLKVAPFGSFRIKTQIFPVENDNLLYFLILTKWDGLSGAPLVQNKQGSRSGLRASPLVADRYPCAAIKIHFGGI